MENDFEPDMYDTDDEYDIPSAAPTIKINVIKSTLATEVDINGQKFNSVNPLYVQELQRTVSQLSNDLSYAKHDIKQLQYRLRQYDSIIRDMRMKLDGKIDRE